MTFQLFLRLVIGGVLAGSFVWQPSRNTNAPPAISPVASPPPNQAEKPTGPPMVRLTDPVAIFRRAFWQRPTATDLIRHAERREWTAPDGGMKWRWFLVVEPSPGLLSYLRKDNAFNLVAAATPPPLKDVPAWFDFAPSSVDAFVSRQGGMKLYFAKAANLLYATGDGSGFTAGTSAPAKPSPSRTSSSAGRLPSRPPPLPAEPSPGMGTSPTRQ